MYRKFTISADLFQAESMDEKNMEKEKMVRRNFLLPAELDREVFECIRRMPQSYPKMMTFSDFMKEALVEKIKKESHGNND